MKLTAERNTEKRRLVGALLSRSFTLTQAELSPTERIALERLKLIAYEGREATQEELRTVVGSAGAQTATEIVGRLVGKGYVEHVTGNPLQRAMWLRIISTGQATAEPRCKVIHWRYRKEPVPTPAIHQVRERSKSIAQMIEAKAREYGKPLHEFLMDCVYAGYHVIAEEAA